jgi:TetR/AcrR family transcriptional regulator
MNRSGSVPEALGRGGVEESTTASRKRILVAATALFELYGARGTTIRQIADAAQVNSQLIYYYFGDKEGLFRAALEGAAERISALLAKTKRADGSAEKRLSSFVYGWVTVTLGEARTIRMLHRAVLEGDEALAARVREHSSAHAAQIGALIAEGIASGHFRSDLDPRRAAASLVGMVNYLAIAGPIVFSSNKLKNDADESLAMAQHTADMFVAGIRAPRTSTRGA